jgi:carbon storage regulator
MLVLSRKCGEEITIGEDIKVIVLRVSGMTVSLGIDAPRELSIMRAELGEHGPKKGPGAA